MNTYLSPASRTGSRSRPATLKLLLLLYLFAILVDPARKAAGLPTSTVGGVYLVVGCIYLVLMPGSRGRSAWAPRYLPLCLVLLLLWCFAEALVPGIPATTALLGFASYVYFVPLLYIGAEVMATDQDAALTLRWVASLGGLLGLGAILSAVLATAAPVILQPIVPSVGVHTSSAGNIYLAPSVFATGEEAAENLLIALFSWAALATLPRGRLGRAWSALLIALITAGLFATGRRADMVVAVVGAGSLLILGRSARRRQSSEPMLMAAPRARSMIPALLLAAICPVLMIVLLGSSKLVPFLTSVSDGTAAVILIFSPAHLYALAGQGTGTATQGVGVLGASTFTHFVGNRTYSSYVQGGRSFLLAEGGLTKTWLELGPVGVALYAGVFISALSRPLSRIRELDGVGQALTMLTLSLGIVFLKGHASLDDPLIQPLFWLAAGGVWGRFRASGEQQNTFLPEASALAASWSAPRPTAGTDHSRR